MLHNGCLLIQFLLLPAIQHFPGDTISKTIVTVGFYQPHNVNSVDTVYYLPGKILQWQDFTGRIPSNAKSAAVSFTSFAYEGTATQVKDTLEIHLDLQVFFVKDDSWAQSFIRDDKDALAHEQIHFDITYLTALLFKNKLASIDFNEEKDYDAINSVIQYQYLEYFRLMNTLQTQYDKETRNGTFINKQKEWQSNIAKAIQLGGQWPLPS